MEVITFTPEKPGQPACKWRIEEEPICYDPESYLLNAVAQDTPDFRMVSLGTISRIEDRFISARVEDVRFETVDEAKQYFAKNIVDLLR